MLRFNPTVFAVNDNYQIIIPVTRDSFAYIEIDDKRFFSHSNGVMRCESFIHKIDVPMSVLNGATAYTVCIRPVSERKGYGAETGEIRKYYFNFSKPPKDNIRIFNISDAHSLINEPIAAAKTYGQINALVLCGDIMHSCNSMEDFCNVYKICSEITGGNIPVVSARGNHDMRGKAAEKYQDYMPSADGKIYYTFRIGSIWGVVLDCGEITADSNPEHGFTICCDPFRHEQTDFLRRIVKDSENEYAADGVKNRIVVVHDPFFEKHNPPYDVARDIFRDWFDIIEKNIKPNFWLCGHSHRTEVRRPPYSVDEFGIKTPLVMASTPGDNFFCGGGFEFNDDGIFLTFADNMGKKEEPIKL